MRELAARPGMVSVRVAWAGRFEMAFEGALLTVETFEDVDFGGALFFPFEAGSAFDLLEMKEGMVAVDR